MVNDADIYETAEPDDIITQSPVHRSTAAELSDFFERDARRYDRGFNEA